MVSKTVFTTVAIAALIVGGVIGYLALGRYHELGSAYNQSQMAGGGPMGGYCPMCGQPWHGAGSAPANIPDKLPAPSSQEWVDRLQDVLGRERLSLAQYRHDEDKYNVLMPYNTVIPQEEDHIKWITQLSDAYGVKPEAEVPPINKSKTVSEAFGIATGLERDLISRYEWLIASSEDSTSREVLDNILFQTRMHYMMFLHAQHHGRMGMMR